MFILSYLFINDSLCTDTTSGKDYLQSSEERLVKSQLERIQNETHMQYN